ncbi:MAG TPA: YkgJ family cysteine cluster protein [Armatimonadota bacterium]|jgi:Fe-S-cluster containining protein
MRAEGEQIDQSPCDGCTDCRHRCTAGIALTRAEYQAIRDLLPTLDPSLRQRVLAQNHTQPWPGSDGGETYEACGFLDLSNGLCLIYAARPLICRLFGHVEWLPCPIEKVRAHWPGGRAALIARTAEETRTYEEWNALEERR